MRDRLVELHTDSTSRTTNEVWHAYISFIKLTLIELQVIHKQPRLRIQLLIQLGWLNIDAYLHPFPTDPSGNRCPPYLIPWQQ